MSFKYTNAMRYLEVGNPTAKFVLYLLADHANESGRCFPSVFCLARETEFSDRAIKKAIALLEKKQFIRVERKTGRCNQYFILFEPKVKKTGEPNSLASESRASDSELCSLKLVNDMPPNHNINSKYNHNFNLHHSKKIDQKLIHNKCNKNLFGSLDLDFFNKKDNGKE